VGIGLGLVGIADLITTFVLFRQLTTANTRIRIKRFCSASSRLNYGSWCRKQDADNFTKLNPMGCYKMLACDGQSSYPASCICNTDRNSTLVHAVLLFIQRWYSSSRYFLLACHSSCLNRNFMSSPWVSVVIFWVGKVTNICNSVAM
jgi:hypothetical protein